MEKKGAGAEPAAAAAAATATAVEELPRSIVRRIVKDKLEQLAFGSSKTNKEKGTEAEGEESDMIVNKEAVLAFSESARIFIHYLSATANDICRESKRQTINAEDVFKALDEIEFSEFVGPLRASLEDYRNRNAAKKSGARGKEASSGKKRKTEEETTQTGEGAAEDGDNVEDNGDD